MSLGIIAPALFALDTSRTFRFASQDLISLG
jgi:hypothetical protein